MKKLNRNGKLIASLLVGAVSGAALGVLLAPSDGEKARKKIAKNVDKFSNDLLKKFKHETELFKSKANSMLASADTKSVNKKAEEGAEEAERIAKEMKYDAKKGAESLKNN
jgi:gas vesicle protein